MRTKVILTAVFAFIYVALYAAPAWSQTDIALSLYGNFPQKESSNGVILSPAASAGGIFELRHIKNPLFGIEGTYAFNRSNQTYSTAIAISCPINPPTPCPPPPARVPANAHEITVDWVPSIRLLHVRPFGVLGGGILLNVPAGDQGGGTSTDTKGVFVYGAGLDWALVPHIGLRLQYRGNLYQAPDLTKLYTSVDKFTHTAQPMIGIYFRL